MLNKTKTWWFAGAISIISSTSFAVLAQVGPGKHIVDSISFAEYLRSNAFEGIQLSAPSYVSMHSIEKEPTPLKSLRTTGNQVSLRILKLSRDRNQGWYGSFKMSIGKMRIEGPVSVDGTYAYFHFERVNGKDRRNVRQQELFCRAPRFVDDTMLLYPAVGQWDEQDSPSTTPLPGPLLITNAFKRTQQKIGPGDFQTPALVQIEVDKP